MSRDRVFRVTLFTRRRVHAIKRVFARSLQSFGNDVAVAVLPPHPTSAHGFSRVYHWRFQRPFGGRPLEYSQV